MTVPRLSPIARCVLPLKDAAVERARNGARSYIDRLLRRLEEAGWDLDKVAPYPDSMRCGKAEYRAQLALRQAYEGITRWVQATRRLDESCLVKRDPEREARCIQQEADAAALAFDAYVLKLERKVGPHDTASIMGDPWSGSTLTATSHGVKEYWHTQQIINRSVYGKAFHQWPTRRLKR